MAKSAPLTAFRVEGGSYPPIYINIDFIGEGGRTVAITESQAKSLLADLERALSELPARKGS